MLKKMRNIALWTVICLLTLSVAYAASLIHWIFSIIIVLLFVGYLLLNYDSINKNG